MNWKALLDAKHAEIQQLASLTLSEVIPSIRNFAQYVTTHKQDLVLIPALKRSDSQTGRSWSDCDLIALAQACDEAEVGAVAVYTEPSLFGTSVDDLRAISVAVSAPVLRLDLVLHPNQIHHSRLYGADAVLLHAGATDLSTLTTLVTVASSTHVAPVVAVQTRTELEHAFAAGAFIVGIASPSGTLDLVQVSEIAALVPPQKTLIALNALQSANEYAALFGKVDAVLVSEVLLDAPDVNATLASLTGSSMREQ